MKLKSYQLWVYDERENRYLYACACKLSELAALKEAVAQDFEQPLPPIQTQYKLVAIVGNANLIDELSSRTSRFDRGSRGCVFAAALIDKDAPPWLGFPHWRVRAFVTLKYPLISAYPIDSYPSEAPITISWNVRPAEVVSRFRWSCDMAKHQLNRMSSKLKNALKHISRKRINQQCQWL